jgi:fructokinase
MTGMRIGIDVGGTKIEVVVLANDGAELLRRRVPTPQSGYEETVAAIAALVVDAEKEVGEQGSVGLAIPGTISPLTGLVKNANSTRLIGHRLDRDIERAIGRKVRVANDANCFALSEATDGAGAGYSVVFGIIAGTGVGGGICVHGRPLVGAHAIAGEWGHNPLPAPTVEEIETAPKCYCGKRGCIESWVSGKAVSSLFARATGRSLGAQEIEAAARSGDAAAIAAMQSFYDRFSRAIAAVVNILDPDAIVLGGGLSNLDALYRELPARVEAYAFTPEGAPLILKNIHGDSSGVRGAAWLWPENDTGGLPT